MQRHRFGLTLCLHFAVGLTLRCWYHGDRTALPSVLRPGPGTSRVLVRSRTAPVPPCASHVGYAQRALMALTPMTHPAMQSSLCTSQSPFASVVRVYPRATRFALLYSLTIAFTRGACKFSSGSHVSCPSHCAPAHLTYQMFGASTEGGAAGQKRLGEWAASDSDHGRYLIVDARLARRESSKRAE